MKIMVINCIKVTSFTRTCKAACTSSERVDNSIVGRKWGRSRLNFTPVSPLQVQSTRILTVSQNLSIVSVRFGKYRHGGPVAYLFRFFS